MASHKFPVAVIGMAVKLPGANNCEEFWELMVDKGDTVATFPKERAEDVDHVVPAFIGQFVDENNPFFTGSFFKSVDTFDADLFGVNPKEALFIEPEQRMFLETTWELLEDSGYASKIRNSKTGVYVGNTVNKYKYILTENHPSISHGNHSPFISSRISYTFNLSGPAMMVATGCSSSLLAVHLACQGLLSGDCDMAIAGGITLDLLPISLKTDIWNQLGITSPNAKCRAFDANAKGIAKAEGCGIVLLKPLDKAIADGDMIYGVLEATTANQDGHSQGITAPHPGAQSNMLTKAWELANISPDCLGYIEAHGTGTELGDPIEIMGITKAYQKMTKGMTARKEKIPIGSVKANIGHLADGAAGVVSLIKVLLCMNKEAIPPVTNFTSPNPHINWERAPVSVNETLRNWKSTDFQPRYGSVSAFGLLGTNIHAVVKEYKSQPVIPESVTSSGPQLLCLAAKTRRSLDSFLTKLVVFFEKHVTITNEKFSRICYTLNTGRELRAFPNRLAVVSCSPSEFASAVRRYTQGKNETKKSKIYQNVLQSSNPSKAQSEIISTFLKGYSINWDTFYRCTNLASKVRVELLPTYVFEKSRYWPDRTEALNRQYLHLEHQISTAIEEPNTTRLKSSCQQSVNIGIDGSFDVFAILGKALNNALGATHDWVEEGNTNLFDLGLDSLVYTHLTMHLMEDFNNHSDFLLTQADLHDNPSFNGLSRFLDGKLHGMNKIVQKTVTDSAMTKDVDNKVEKFGHTPLSYSQRRLWLIEKMEKAGSTYNATNCFTIKGETNEDALTKAIETVVRRHDAFFITIKEIDGKPYIVYDWNADIDLKIIDASSNSTHSECTALESYDTDYKRPFDLSTGPLVRIKLYKIASDRYMFTMVIHHIIFDGWSHFLFYNEMWDNYKRCIGNHTLSVHMHQPLSSHFSKIENEDALLKSSKIQNDLEYWVKQLSSPLPLTTFPGDKKRPQTFTYEGGRLIRFLDMKIFKCLKHCVGGQHTMFHSILSTVFVLLQHFNPADTDFLVGIPVTGRHTMEMKDVIGCFINTLVIRLSMNKTMTFAEVLQCVAKTCFDAQDHQLAPFDHLVSKLKLPRNTSISPVFSVNVCYHNEEQKHGHINPPDELAVKRKLLHNGTSKWDMQFDFLEEGNEMRFTLEYYKGVFSDSYAENIADMLTESLHALSKYPNTPLTKYFIGEASIMQGVRVPLGNRTLTQTLMESLDKYPDSEIHGVDGKTYKYMTLKKDAIQLTSFFLKDCLLRKGDRVGLLFENCYEGLTVIMACLLTGIVYVPLNPENPKARLEYIVRSAGIKIVCFDKESFTLASYLLWTSECMKSIFCVNGNNMQNVTETQENPLMDTELWNCVAEEARSDIEGGGWKSSFTGEHLSGEEMKDYIDNVFDKLADHGDSHTTVLEIGCASGLTTQALCSRVKEYIATDLSKGMVENIKGKHLRNVKAYCVPAHEIGAVFKNQTFDLIILNSVVHCFPGYNYLRQVLKACAAMLTSHGKIYVGDVMDLEKRDDLQRSLKSFKASNPNCRTKTDLSAELFLPKEFFESFDEMFPNVVCSPKRGLIENELTKYRYDVLMTKECSALKREPIRHRAIFSVNDLKSDDNEPQSRRVYPEDDAYIMFTSGTTGTPKGVRIGQKALLNYCQWASSAYGLNIRSTMPLFSPLTFDFTVTSIFPPLLQGATLMIFKPFAESYEAMADCNSLTVAKFSPLQLETILTSAKGPLSMSTFILGGEEITYPLLKKLQENKQEIPFQVWNEYGPTEATVGCVVRCIDHTEIDYLKEHYIPIGKPINNVTVAITHCTKPVSLGTRGFLSIGGCCLTSGFLQSKSENCNAFNSACWSQDGSLMYTTTDIVACTVDKHQMLYFGRDSTDITKINGMRIDISEVQSSIRTLAYVEEAWVCPVEVEGAHFLGAAVKLIPNVQLTDEDLKSSITKELTQILPLYCIPKSIVQLVDAPTNKNGKKDTAFMKKLFKSNMEKSTEDKLYLTNESELKVQKIWQEILPINRLPGVNEDFFFELSGDSLQAIHLVRKMRTAGFSLNVSDIFRYPTIKLLCLSLQQSHIKTDENKQNPVEIQPFRPTPIAEQYMRIKRKSDRFAVPAMLELKNPLAVEVVQKALRAVILKHRSLASRFFIEKGQVFQQYTDIGSKPNVVEATLTKQIRNIVQDPVFTKTCEELESQLDIDNGNLLNAAVFRSETKHYCLIVIHHITVDIVSWQQILEDFSVALEIVLSGKETTLPPATVPFDKYCAELWQEGKRSSDEEIKYWQNVIKNSKSNEPFQKSPEQSLYSNAKWESQSVDSDIVRKLSIAIGGTDEAVILTALGKAFSNLENIPLTVCLESHGRQLNLDTTDTVGWCTSMFPFTIAVQRENDFGFATRKVMQNIQEIPLHGLRYGPIVGVGKVKAELPSTMFVFQGSLDAASKEEFKAGAATFKYLPWVEVLIHDLENGNYHRDEQDPLDFPLEVICWFHSGLLRIGCLFDRKKVSSEWVNLLLQGMTDNLMDASKTVSMQTATISESSKEIEIKKLENARKNQGAIQLLTNITITPDVLSTTKELLLHEGLLGTDVVCKEPSDFYQVLMQDKISDYCITIIVVRCTTKQQEEEIEHAVRKFLMCNQGTEIKLILISIENIPKSIPLDKSKLADVPIHRMKINEVEYDATADADYNVPFTVQGYRKLSFTIARNVVAVLRRSEIKVICVDGDYTLWDGESANTDVSITAAHRKFQTFLLQKVHEGYLLVLMSKNRLEDVGSVLVKDEMILEKNNFVHLEVNWRPKSVNILSVSKCLDISLHSFMFIDDSSTECEEMLRAHPQVKTLRFPSVEDLIEPFISSLWILDTVDITSEAACRTEMYRNEVSRRIEGKLPEINKSQSDCVGGYLDLLKSWKMKMLIWKSSIKELLLHSDISKRVAELLHRTNQFKLNDKFLKLEDLEDQDECFVFSLDDSYGKYGIIAVIIIDHQPQELTVKQWVMSCRALGRKVEDRLLHEITLHTVKGCTDIALHFINTGKNIPMVEFIQRRKNYQDDKTYLDTNEVHNICFDLHEIEVTSNPSLLMLSVIKTQGNQLPYIDTLQCNVSQRFEKLRRWIENNLSSLHREHLCHNHVLPSYLLQNNYDIPVYKKIERKSNNALEEIWMGVLQTQKQPDINDSFVKSGGNSFQAVFLISKIMSSFGVKLELVDVLTQPYNWINREIKSRVTNKETVYNGKAYTQTMELSQAQKRMWLMQSSLKESTAYTETIAVQIGPKRPVHEIVCLLTENHPLLMARLDTSITHLSIGRSTTTVDERYFDNMHDLIQELSRSKPVFAQPDKALSKFLSFTCGAINVLVIHVHHMLVDDITLHNITTSLIRLAKSEGRDIQTHNRLHEQIESSQRCVRLEREYIESATFMQDKHFWETTFADCPEETSLGLKHISDTNEFVPKTAETSTLDIPADIHQQITNKCHAYGVTEFQYILACYVLVAQRYTAKEDILLAVPVSNRDSGNITIDGLIVNTILFRHKVNMEHTLEEHIKCVAENWLCSYSHSKYPVNFVGQIILERFGKSLSSICNQMFNFATFEQQETEIKVDSKHAKMPFSIDVVKTKNGLRLVSEYATDLINGKTVENLMGSMLNILTMDQYMAKVRDIEILMKYELQELGVFSKSHRLPPENTHVFEMFLRNVETTAESTALVFRERKTTYRELNNCVCAIASRILQKSTPMMLRTKPCLVHMDKSDNAVAAMLAVWKVGGFFMPMSTLYSSQLSDIIMAVNPGVVLIGNSFDSLKTGQVDCDIINIETVEISTTTQVTECPTLLDMDRTAYVIRTSGSTGKPKEISINHKGLAILASAWTHEYQMSDLNVNLLQWAPLSFDVFIGDIVRGLCCSAGKVVLCPDNKRLDTHYLVSLIMSEKITIAEVTPQFGLMLTQKAENGQLDSLKVFILGSDTLQKEVYTKVKRILKPPQRVLNSYGMTEATIDSAYFEGDDIPSTRGGNVPIGKPLPGVVMKVLDPLSLRPCPVGVIGELFIGGDVIGTGEVTTIEMQDGEKLLKTNDYACWLYSGDIELCGRKDTMCKLRGFRIDCAHIENAILKNCANVVDVSVSILTENVKGQENEHLCAYIVKSEKCTANTDIPRLVKAKIQDKLPYYMVPDFIECIEAIPLTNNGKVDRKKLPGLRELYQKRIDFRKQVRVENPIADVLRQLFAESLGLESTFIDDERTFMEQGGHSLILMTFSSMINERTDLNVTIVDVFSYPSINLLAEKAAGPRPEIIDQKNDARKKDQTLFDIAICGVGIRLPKNTRSIGEFWELLEKQVDLVSDFPQTRKEDVLNCSDSELSNTLQESDVYRGLFLEEIDKFDNEAFNIPSTEAQAMSPEQRLFLEVASETLAQGTNIAEISGSNIGVFVSQAEIGYAKLSHPDEATSISGLMPGMIATRVAYNYNLKGPAMLVDTACSSGITALKAACSSIEKGECKAAIVGGMNVVLFPARTGVHGNNGIMSPDFKCRPFDKKANGTAVGEGVLCFYLEPLQEALKQNKHVYAVIKSIGINNVGTGNGITAPTAQSQEDAIRSSLYQANISPQDISFIETHGTGTVLGDKIELSALSAIFNTGDTKRKLPIGSVKSNLGHLDSAAGLAGLLKIIAGYMFETIPPTKNFENPHTELTGSTLYVPVNSEPWLSSINIPRVAGVSSFGLTGTNTHMIVSDSVKKSARPVPAQVIPLLLCGATYDHIRRQAASYGKLIHQTVVKRSINTIQDITVTVLAKLGQLQKSGLLHTKHRVAILDCDAQKMSNSLDWVRSCENEIQLNNVTYKSRILYRNDSFQCKDNSFTDDTSLCINEFLTYSFIDKIESFAGANIDPDFCAPGLTIPIFDSKRHWLQPSMKGNRGCYGLIDILHRNISKTRELVRTLKLSPSPTLLEYEARFCCSIILNLLKATGLKDAIDNQQDITLESSLEKTGMLQKYDKLFFIMIRELLNSNFVIPKGSDTQKLNLDIYAFRCRDIILPSPKQIAEEAMTKYAQWADCFKFPLHCSTHLKEVLWGQMSPLSVIYPQGDLNFMYQFDKLGDLLGDVYYNMYMQIIVEYAARLSRKGKTVRILEVGAGMGHVTRQLLPSLSEIPNIEYWFTDLGRAFVENAKTLFEKYVSMMRFSTFDITKNSVQQGLLGTYDIIISYNVIHTTESIYKSVNNLRTCLGEDGTLFIIESAKNETWATLAWGILDGWWYFKDYDLRPYEPMLEPEKWREVLKNSGFRSIHSCPMAEEEISHVEKFLFVCSNKKKDAEYIPAPTDGWWKTIDLTAHRHADFDMESSCSDESGLGEEGKVSRSLVKSELKRIWCELLDLEDINDDEDFNALGGESLLAIQMMTMVRKRIGYALEIADTFCYTSLGSLGDYISDRLEAEVSQQSNSGSSTSSSDNELQQQIGKSATMCKLMTGATGHLLMFPGQGSQKVGMCKTMENCEAAREVFMKAEDILGYNILDICIGPENILREKLKSTEFVQVALFVSCLAKISQIQLDEPEVLKGVTHVAGLSVGEFAALVYAKVLKFEDALMLVQQRGRAMEKEVAKASTAMASVLGPSKSKLEHFLNVNIPNAVISTCLADNQHTVAGTESDIINLVEMLSQSHQDSLSVMDVRRLRVAGGFHSRFMVDAEKEIMPLIENCTFSKPKLALIMNITGKISDDPAAIKTMVSRQIIEPVQWKDTMITAHEAGVRRFTEIAPARVLSSIVRTRIEKCRGCTSDLIQV